MIIISIVIVYAINWIYCLILGKWDRTQSLTNRQIRIFGLGWCKYGFTIYVFYEIKGFVTCKLIFEWTFIHQCFFFWKLNIQLFIYSTKVTRAFLLRENIYKISELNTRKLRKTKKGLNGILVNQQSHLCMEGHLKLGL